MKREADDLQVFLAYTGWSAGIVGTPSGWLPEAAREGVILMACEATQAVAWRELAALVSGHRGWVP